ncbi:MAG: hypothetical protein MOGMAGMI_00080 [Candidatus Omnitrophica bacterium]|nr:hypothetical protein [Candidatus Omnitrophota bacterium]
MTHKILSWTLCALILGQSLPVSAADLPQGYEAVAGSSSYTVSPDGLSGTLIALDGVTIGQWSGGFNIGDGHVFTALIPEGGAHLSRDITDSPSRIFGSLQVPTGRFFLVNTNGIYFAPGATVNAAGLVASSLDLRNEDFLSGRYEFFQSGPAASVVNDGVITTGEGGAYLLGGAVLNRGTILSRAGHVELAAGSRMTLALDPQGYLSVAVTEEVREAVEGPEGRLSAAAANTGTLRADGGVVVLTAETVGAVFDHAVNQEGLIEADTVGTREGRIFLGSRRGEGVVRQTGTVRARGDEGGERGGHIDILGQKVGLFGGEVDASGQAGGGAIRIGGDKQGRGEVRLSDAVYVAPEAVVRADALSDGDGGEIIVWSERSSRVYGQLSARGGAVAGDGGFIETSSREDLEVATMPDVSALNGVGGTWLLDPRNVDISAATVGGAFAGGNPDVFTPTANNATVSATTVNSALDAGISVFINTGNSGAQAGNIRVLAPIVKSSGPRASLVLNAIGDVTTTSAISAAGAAILDVEIIALDDISIQSAITTGGGNINVFGDQFTITAAGSVTTSGGSFGLTGANAVSIGGAISTGSGSVTLTTSNNISVTATGSITTTSGDIALSATGANRDITVAGALISASGDIALTAADAITVSNAVTATTGDVTLSGGGNITLSGANADIIAGGSYTATADSDSNGSGTYNQNNAGGSVVSGGPIDVSAVTVSASGSHQSAGDLSMSATNGNLTLGAAGSLTSTGGDISLNSTAATRDISLSGALSATAGDIAVTANDVLTVSSTVNAGGDIALQSGGGVTLSGANADITAGGDYTVDADTDANGTGTYTQNNAGSAVTATGDTTITAANAALSGTHAGSGALVLRPSMTSTSVGIGGGAGTFNLSDAELASLQTGYSSITIGRGDSTALATVSSSAFNDPTTVLMGGAGGRVTVTGAVTTTNDALTLAAGTGDTGTLTINPGIAVSTGAGDVTLRGDSVAIGAGATVNTTGDVTLEPASPSRPIVLGAAGAVSDFALTAAELAAINASANSLIIGRSDGNHAFTTAGFTSGEPTVFRGATDTALIPAVTALSGPLGLNVVDANHFALNSAGDITDTNGASLNLSATTTSYITSGGTAGTLTDPIEVNITSGDLVLDLSGASAGVSGAFAGSVGGRIVILNAPGIVYFNGIAINDPLTVPSSAPSDEVKGALELAREYGLTEASRTRAALSADRGLPAGRFDLSAVNRLARVIVDPSLLRRWVRVRPAVVEPARPVVAPTPLPVPPVEPIRPIPAVRPAPAVPVPTTPAAIRPVTPATPAPLSTPVPAAVRRPVAATPTPQPLQPLEVPAPLARQTVPVLSPGQLPRLAGGPLRQVDIEEQARSSSPDETPSR